MNTYTWEVESLDCVPDNKVVSCIHWRLKGDDGTSTTEVYGTQTIENNAENPFIEYESLAKEDVIAWLEEAMGEEKIAQLHDSLSQQLESLANHSVVTPTLPWK